MERILKTAIGIAALAAIAIGGSACGDDDAPAPSTGGSPSGAAVEDVDKRPPAQTRAGKGPEEENAPAAEEVTPSGPPPSAREAAEEDSGGGSEQFRVPRGDNSIQGFGEEASDSERESAAIVLHGFLQAQARGQWTAACTYLAQSVLGQLRLLADQVEEVKGEGCPEILEALSPPISRTAAAELTNVDVGSLRIEDDRGFILYEGAGGEIYTVSMVNEDGEWKLGSLAPVPLS